VAKNRRVWVAVLLAAVYPGLGHVYLREWLRALLWFGLQFASLLVVFPDQFADEGAIGEFSIDAILAASRQLPWEATLAIAVVTGFSMLDAYWLATQDTADGGEQTGVAEEGRSCPSCGREIDESLDFCHWCTTEFDEDGEPVG